MFAAQNLCYTGRQTTQCLTLGIDNKPFASTSAGFVMYVFMPLSPTSELLDGIIYIQTNSGSHTL